MTAGAELGRVRPIVEHVVGSHGLDTFDVQLRREAIGWVLRVFIDRPGAAPEEAISIEDCQHVSQDLSAVLDVEDPFVHPYTLEVSSPGLDRPLRKAEDYRRFSGRLASLVLREALDGQSHVAGRLRGVEADLVLLEGPRGRIHRIPLAAISRARLEVEFSSKGRS